MIRTSLFSCDAIRPTLTVSATPLLALGSILPGSDSLPCPPTRDPAQIELVVASLHTPVYRHTKCATRSDTHVNRTLHLVHRLPPAGPGGVVVVVVRVARVPGLDKARDRAVRKENVAQGAREAVDHRDEAGPQG